MRALFDHGLTTTCLAALALALGTATASATEPIQTPYSWRGIDGSGVSPAGDLVSEFWDIPSQG
jgi:hypothetical protein